MIPRKRTVRARANSAVLLTAEIASLVRGDEKSGAQLLFGLWHWAFDRGVPSAASSPTLPCRTSSSLRRRTRSSPRHSYISFTNSFAFCPGRSS